MNILSKFILIFGILAKFEAISSYTLNNLYQEGDVFNIEGGKDKLHLNPYQKWCNMIVVLDRPLIENMTYDDILQNNTFPLKESYLLDYNEAQVNHAYLCTITFLFEKERSFFNKKFEDPFTLCIHIHRNRSSPPLMALIVDLLQTSYNQKFKLFENEDHLSCFKINKHTSLVFRSGVRDKDMRNYDEKIDIVYSLSLGGGLHPNYPSGSLIFPKKFIPFDEKENVLTNSRAYEVENLFLSTASQLLAHQTAHMRQVVDSHFLSPNPLKKDHCSRPFKQEDFKTSTCLVVNDLWSPRDSYASYTYQDKVISVKNTKDFKKNK